MTPAESNKHNIAYVHYYYYCSYCCMATTVIRHLVFMVSGVMQWRVIFALTYTRLPILRFAV